MHQGQALLAGDPVPVDDRLPAAAAARGQAVFGVALQQVVVPDAVGDQVADGADPQAMPPGEADQLRQAGHAAVIIHDLADHAGRIEPGNASHIHRRLGMARTDQHAAVAGHEREDVTGTAQLVGAARTAYRNRDGAGSVGRRDAGRDAVPRLDRDGKGSVLVPPAR